MNDYVKRSDVINYVCQFCKDQHADELCDEWDACQLFTRISDVPSADVVERKHGKILTNEFGYESCSVCNYGLMLFITDENNILRKPNYCPNCGAKMENMEGKT